MRKGWVFGGIAVVVGGALVAVHTAGAHTPLAVEMHGPEVPQAAESTAPLADGLTEVPLRLDDGRLLVPVDIGQGVQADFILSTGNAVTVLSQEFADRHDTGGPFRLGDVEVNLERAATIPHEQLAPNGEMVAGIIGANSLNRYDILIDAPGERLLLKPAAREVSWEGMALSDPVRLRVYHGVVIGLDVEVNGTMYPAMLDTGTPSLVMNTGAGTALGLAEEGEVSLTLGAARMDALPGRVNDLPIFERWDPEGTGFLLVGAPIAWECAVAISWMHRELRTCAQ